jgi:tetratricopeptide (TPR) repeat protein
VTDGSFSLVPDAQISMPAALRDVWSERIDAVLPVVHPSVVMAAVLGCIVRTDEWTAACANLELQPALDQIEALMAARLARASDHGFSFAHEMVREALAARVETPERSRALHAAAVEAIPKKLATSRRRARHLIASEQLDAAIAELTVAAVFLRQKSIPLAAALYAEQGRLLTRVGAEPTDVRWGEQWVRRAILLSDEGRYQDVRTITQRIIDVGTSLPAWQSTVGRAWLHRAIACRIMGDIEAATTALAEARLHAARVSEAVIPDQNSQILTEAGHLARTRGDYAEALRIFTSATEQTQPPPTPARLADAYVGLGTTLEAMGRWQESGEAYARAEPHLRDAHMGWGLAMSWTGQGEAARRQGDLDTAEVLYRQALALSTAGGFRYAALNRLNLAMVVLQRGRYEEARREFSIALRELERAARRRLEAAAHAGIAASCAGLALWSAFDEHMASAESLLRITNFSDPDLDTLLEVAATKAEAAGWTHRARQARALKSA